MKGMLNLPQPGAPSELADLSPDSLRAQMKVQGPQGEQLDRIVLAGKKVMFSEQSHELVMQQLQGPGELRDKIGQGVAGLLGLLMQESNNSLPPELLIPAGLILVAEAVRFLREAGQDVSDEDVGGSMAVLVSSLMRAGGVDPEKAKELGGKGAPGAAPKGAMP
jgi:hypothetical protein